MPPGLVPRDMLSSMRQRSPPTKPTRSHQTMAASPPSDTPSLSDSNTPTSIQGIPPDGLTHTPSRVALRMTTGEKPAKRTHSTSTNSTNTGASTPPNYLPFVQGIIRGVPTKISNYPQQTYYSEKSYPTPMMPPTPERLAAQVQKIADCRAALKRPRTTADKRDKRARKRVFRVKKERTYRVADPEFQEIIEVEVPDLAPIRSRPRRGADSEVLSPLDLPSPYLGAAPGGFIADSESSCTSSDDEDDSRTTEQPADQPRVEISESDDELTELEDLEELRDRRAADRDETETAGVEVADSDEASGNEEVSDDQVTPGNKVASEAETLSSYEDDGGESEYSEFEEPVKTSRRARPVKRSKPDCKPTVCTKSTSGAYCEAQRVEPPPVLHIEPVSELTLPKNRLGTNWMPGYSTTVLRGPRIM